MRYSQPYKLQKKEKSFTLRPKRILLAMIEAGGGHKSPAVAVKEAIEQVSGDEYEILLTDFMKYTGCIDLDTRHKKSWDYFLAHPLLCKSSHILADLSGPFFRIGLKYYLSPFFEPVHKFLMQYKPDLIFSTHPFNTIAIDYVRKRYGIEVILINYLTEIFDATSHWIIKGVDYYIVSSERAKNKLILRGIPKGKLYVFDYPLKREFFDVPSSKRELLRGFGIEPSKKTLLISFGSQGRGSPVKYIDALVQEDIPLNILIITGKNVELSTSLQERYRNFRGNINLIILGYVNNMHELIYISDFCFIKPGPSTTMEVMAFKKPIIFYKSAQMSEIANMRFILKNGIGDYVGDNIKKFVRLMKGFTYGLSLEKTNLNYKKLKIRNGAPDIARFIIDIIENKDITEL